MKVGVVGGGAIGLLITGYLSQHVATTLYVRRNEQKEALETDGLLLKKESGMLKIRPTVKLSSAQFEEDIIIFAVKQTVLSEKMDEWLKRGRSHQTYLFLPNGASHVTKIKDHLIGTIGLGVVEHGSRKINDTTIEEHGHGKIRIAAYQGSFDSNAMEPLLNIPDFPIRIDSAGWKEMIYEKLILNAIINPLTALYRVTNGRLYENTAFRNSARQLFEETSLILYQEIREDRWQKINEVCQNTYSNHSSMKQDIDTGKKTEIDAITGYIIDKASTEGRDVPLSSFIYKSIKGLSEPGGKVID